ncbi:hypothetical protein [Streptomyces sp. NBC_01022]|uniref:hypothetical protein n=1 Tax=Streptomyces sp. NBC_01022 TaxID=2903723 RepID=UPI002DDBD67E|nr:hypothetical protein [Streptomyces sp. NBC_01022]WRZ82401.1 hypothetical protein OG316_20125 [Streptomyces sp. NBC_01022]
MGALLPDDPTTTPSDLDTPTESLQKFKIRVDKLLTALDGSPAAHGRITEQKVVAEAYGSKTFPEAVGLSDAYTKVHGRLTELSRTLSDQLEAMGITVDMADRGYLNVDHEHAERLNAIQERTEARYRKPESDKDPETPVEDKTGTGPSSGQDGM